MELVPGGNLADLVGHSVSCCWRGTQARQQCTVLVLLPKDQRAYMETKGTPPPIFLLRIARQLEQLIACRFSAAEIWCSCGRGRLLSLSFALLCRPGQVD